jgi:hypothetical protein
LVDFTGFLGIRAFMKRVLFLSIFVVIAVGISGCSQTTFRPWSGPAMMIGSGGTSETIDGIDIWIHGTPPMRYEVLGIIDDDRNQSPMGMMGYKKSLVAVAKANGGDALIQLSEQSQTTGNYKAPENTVKFASGSELTTGGGTTAIRRQFSTWAVIRYHEGQ